MYSIISEKSRAHYIVFVYQETSGTGIFFYVVANVSGPTGYTGTNGIFLGDRIAPQNINIDTQKGTAAVNFVTRKDTDPMTVQLSIGVTKKVQVKGGELVII